MQNREALQNVQKSVDKRLYSLYNKGVPRGRAVQNENRQAKKDLKKSKKVLDKQNKVRYTNSVPNTNTTGRKEIRPTNEKGESL